MEKVLTDLAKNSNIDFSTLDFSKASEIRKKKEKELQEEIKKARKFNEEKKKRLIYSNIPYRFRGMKFRDLEKTSENEKIIDLCYKTVNEIDEINKGLYLYGDCGVGKTTLISIMAQLLGDYQKKEVYFASEEDILSEIRNAYNKDSELQDTDIIRNICKNDVIFIDEIGQSTSEWALKILKRIIDECIVKQKLMFFTSNYTYSDLIKRWEGNQNNVLALQIVDRLQEVSKIVKLGGKSWRNWTWLTYTQ